MENNLKLNLIDSEEFILKRFPILNKLKKYIGSQNINEDEIFQFDSKIKDIENKLGIMKRDMNSLNEIDKNIWSDKIKELNSKFEDYKKQFEEIHKESKDDKPIDYNNLTTEEAYKKGNEILDKDEKILGNLIDIIQKDNETLVIVSNNLDYQKKRLEEISPVLNEIQFSLKRSKNKLTNMLKILLKDKFIICLIVAISIIILTIIIVSSCKGNKNNDNNKYNLPVDIFSSNNKDNNNSNGYSFGLFYKYYYAALFILFSLL